MATRAKKPIHHTSSIEGAVDDAKSELQSLKEEMESWKDNLEAANMEHLPKYEEVSECYEVLEDIENTDLDIPDTMPAGLEDKVEWTELPPRSRRPSRAYRASSAVAALNTVADYLDAFLNEHDDDDVCWADCERSEWEQYAEDCREMADKADGLNFPGMFG